jgi:hypothetical protein
MKLEGSHTESVISIPLKRGAHFFFILICLYSLPLLFFISKVAIKSLISQGLSAQTHAQMLPSFFYVYIHTHTHNNRTVVFILL